MLQKFLQIILLVLLSISANAGEKKPMSLVIKTRDNQIFDLNKMRGKITIVSFFASWCKPCLIELAELEEIHHTQKNIEIIAINLDHLDEDRNLKFTRKYSYKFAKLSDSMVNGFDEPSSIPTTYLIGCDGVVAKILEDDISVKESLQKIKCD